jgi:cytochrome d ubiquinol oxidase subunit II
METPTVAAIWFFLIGFILWLYVVLDGFDLGVGIISLLSPDEDHRSILMGSLGNVWHANQTWLVVLGGLLFGAFPVAYGVVLSALYLPIMLMLFGLIFRGVSFEFRAQAHRKAPWNLAFGLGSLLVTLAQGFILGGLLMGLKVEKDLFAGGVWDWLSPFAFLVAVGFTFAYLLLGAVYLILKTEGEIQRSGFRLALLAAILVLALALGAGWWATSLNPFLAQKWLAWPGFFFTLLPMLLGLVAFMMLLFSLRKRYEKAPFFWSLLLFFFSYLGLTASLYPYLIPPAVTVTRAAASPLILEVMLIVMGFLLPVMLIYNVYQYRVFRGKTPAGGYGYED